jgi:hypothetical protein
MVLSAMGGGAAVRRGGGGGGLPQPRVTDGGERVEEQGSTVQRGRRPEAAGRVRLDATEAVQSVRGCRKGDGVTRLP